MSTVTCPGCRRERVISAHMKWHIDTGRSSGLCRSCGRRAIPVADLWTRLERHIVHDASGCWLWTAGRTSRGYGLAFDGVRTRLAHRVVWLNLRGSIPQHHDLDHLCRNPSCVNPEHLEPVTPAENKRRAAEATRTEHCPNGHLYDEANTYIGKDGYRKCRTCRRDDMRNRYQAASACP